MKTRFLIALLSLGFHVPAAHAQIPPADVPAILDLLVQRITPRIRRHSEHFRSRGQIEGGPIYLDAASLAPLRAAAPGLSRLPAEGRGFTTRAKDDSSRGVFVTIDGVWPGEGPGDYSFFVIPAYPGTSREPGLPVVYTIAKIDGAWTGTDAIVLVP